MKTEYWNENQNLIDAFSKIDAIDFEYNDKAKELYDEDVGVDTDEHIGVKAQDLEDNPATPNVVKEDEDTGYLTVNTKELTMSNTAVLSEVCKAIIEIQKFLGIDDFIVSDEELKKPYWFYKWKKRDEEKQKEAEKNDKFDLPYGESFGQKGILRGRKPGKKQIPLYRPTSNEDLMKQKDDLEDSLKNIDNAAEGIKDALFVNPPTREQFENNKDEYRELLRQLRDLGNTKKESEKKLKELDDRLFPKA